MFATLFGVGQLFGADADVRWGKRIWEKAINDKQRIVVDERYLNGDPQQPQSGRLTYVWRLFSDDREEAVLFECPGDNSDLAGLTPERKPVTVLYTALIDGDLVTVFNQKVDPRAYPERAWAYQVHRDSKNRFDRVPEFRSNANSQSPGSVEWALRTAQLNKLPSGELELLGENAFKQKLRYRLDKYVVHEKGLAREVHYWQLTDVWMAE